MKIEMGWAQSSVIRALLNPTIRFIVCCAGRRFGKSTLAVSLLIWFAMNQPGRYAYLAPSYSAAKRIAWGMLKELLPEDAVASIHESELRVVFTNGAEIMLFGAERADNLRGIKLAGCVVDEFAVMKASVWNEVLRPALADSRGWGLFISTPRSFNHFKEFFDRGLSEEFKEWVSFQFKTIDGGRVASDELDAAKRELDKHTYLQEFEASFEALSNRVLYAFNRHLHVDSERAEFKPENGPVYAAQDYNVDPSAIVLAQRHDGLLRAFDEQILHHSNTPMVAKALKLKLEKYNVLPSGVVVLPDPSGNSRKTSANSGVTDHSIMREHGFSVRAMSSAPKVVDRLNHTNAVLLNAADEVRMVVHPRCKSLIETCEGWTYKLDAHGRVIQIPDESGGLDHVGDALGYMCCQLFTMPGRGVTMVHD